MYEEKLEEIHHICQRYDEIQWINRLYVGENIQYTEKESENAQEPFMDH